jgi:hypothetical protein
LPNRTSSRRYYGTSTTPSHQSSSASYLSSVTGPLGRQKSDSSFDRERPFVAVKRAHEQSRKFRETQVSAVNHLDILYNVLYIEGCNYVAEYRAIERMLILKRLGIS